MATAFANRITNLRKNKGLSQKEAAMSLGVSQALLSHYEKGVRECGLDFVLRCADYYGVTTDYLLGKQDSNYGMQSAFDNVSLLSTVSPEEKIDVQQLLLFMNYIAEEFGTTDSLFGDKIRWTLALMEYKILVGGINSGIMKPEWFDKSFKAGDKVYQNFVDAVWRSLFTESLESVSGSNTPSGNPFPAFSNNLIMSVEEYVEQIAAKNIQGKNKTK